MEVLRAAKPLSTPPISLFAGAEGNCKGVAEQLPLNVDVCWYAKHKKGAR
jgi:hypothetical protein